jgi:hypothetical protein
MNSYTDRQEQVSWFMEGEELLRTFRGVGKAAIDAAKPFANEHWRLQKNLSESALYQALRGEKVWDQVADVLGDMFIGVHQNPRPYCSPPDIPDDWDAFRKTLIEYAPNTWWYQTLKLEDLCKPSSWQSWLSGSTPPKVFDDIRARARDWRSRVLQGLDAWEISLKEEFHWRDMIEFRVKDALDAGGREAGWEAFLYLRRLDRAPNYQGMFPSSIYDRRCFDPAQPDREPWSVSPLNPDDVRDEFEAMLSSGFKRYRDPTPQPTKVEKVVAQLEWCSDDYMREWSLPTEIERTSSWDPILRDYQHNDRILRIQVLVPASYAVDGEEIMNRRERKFDKITRRQSTFEDKGQWTYTWEHYVFRWRDYDPEHDTRGGTVGRDVVMKRCGLDLENDDPARYQKPVRPPIEDLGRSHYSVG